MVAELITTIVGSAAITVSFILVGFRLLFYTQVFDQEYDDKVRRIRDYKNGLLVDAIDELNRIREEALQQPGIVELGDPLRELSQLAEVRRLAREVERWAEIIEQGKRAIRLWSLALILLGIAFTAVFTLLVSDQDLQLIGLVVWYGVGSLLVATFYFGMKYWRLISRIDREYIAVRQRATRARQQESATPPPLPIRSEAPQPPAERRDERAPQGPPEEARGK